MLGRSVDYAFARLQPAIRMGGIEFSCLFHLDYGGRGGSGFAPVQRQRCAGWVRRRAPKWRPSASPKFHDSRRSVKHPIP
jgi:hypothetical protein